MQRFSDRDRTAAIALTIYEGLFCPDCGQLKAEAWQGEGAPGADMEGWYEAKALTCVGCEALHQYAKEQKDQDPAEKVYLLNTKRD
ncbi:hypothetical protein [Segeticoccus rhizosphaerae]|uniref:hypothetical protein n=1 Tax=Segeticoccus rhizosphaerae TaxID=1104777 RepID=UPI0012653081|nr:hypothetical protein [Segeticoccus rhizosphaerae]